MEAWGLTMLGFWEWLEFIDRTVFIQGVNFCPLSLLSSEEEEVNHWRQKGMRGSGLLCALLQLQVPGILVTPSLLGQLGNFTNEGKISLSRVLFHHKNLSSF